MRGIVVGVAFGCAWVGNDVEHLGWVHAAGTVQQVEQALTFRGDEDIDVDEARTRSAEIRAPPLHTRLRVDETWHVADPRHPEPPSARHVLLTKQTPPMPRDTQCCAYRGDRNAVFYCQQDRSVRIR